MLTGKKIVISGGRPKTSRTSFPPWRRWEARSAPSSSIPQWGSYWGPTIGRQEMFGLHLYRVVHHQVVHYLLLTLNWELRFSIRRQNFCFDVNKRQCSTWWITLYTVGRPVFARFWRKEFGEFPRPALAVGSYSSGPPAGGTPQILLFKT